MCDSDGVCYVQVLLESGPVPYASYNSVTFVAEQVSHHPPGNVFIRMVSIHTTCAVDQIKKCRAYICYVYCPTLV